MKEPEKERDGRNGGGGSEGGRERAVRCNYRTRLGSLGRFSGARGPAVEARGTYGGGL